MQAAKENCKKNPEKTFKVDSDPSDFGWLGEKAKKWPINGANTPNFRWKVVRILKNLGKLLVDFIIPILSQEFFHPPPPFYTTIKQYEACWI